MADLYLTMTIAGAFCGAPSIIASASNDNVVDMCIVRDRLNESLSTVISDQEMDRGDMTSRQDNSLLATFSDNVRFVVIDAKTRKVVDL